MPGMEDESKPFTEEEQRQRVGSNHAICDTRCELCVQTCGLARHPKQIEAESVISDYARVGKPEASRSTPSSLEEDREKKPLRDECLEREQR